MESFFFTNINIIFVGLIGLLLLIILAFQIKNRKLGRFLHYLREKFSKSKKK
ncbi:MAG: hypothetical protein IGBAC_1299 [Ignavibacteriae bacterium]|nr:MAG: hypothetical protein IGBAC_1299 [Ignavibacteriota bacterium]